MNKQELITLVVIVLTLGISLNFLFTWIGNANDYRDARTGEQMVACQTAGYTYGECFNVVFQRDTYKFVK